LIELIGGGMAKIGQEENMESEQPATKIDFLKQIVGQPSEVSQPSALDGGAEVPAALKKVFKKDFRAIMKRIDEQKKGTASGGYIDTTKLLSG
jgi:hypothetical protein